MIKVFAYLLPVCLFLQPLASRADPTLASSSALDEGMQAFAEHDFARSVSIFMKLCDAGMSQACNNAGLQYANGMGVDRDGPRAVELYQRACSLGSTSCFTNLGLIYDEGRGVAEDAPHAASLYEKGCNAGDGMGCKRLADLALAGRGVPKDEAHANELFTQACDRKIGDACEIVGESYVNGRGVPKDEGKGFSFFDKGCALGSGAGCFNIADLFRTAKKNGRASELFHASCEMGYARGCTQYALMIDMADPAQGAAYYKRGCDGADPHGCASLATLYEFGWGLKKNPQAAVEFYQKALALHPDADLEGNINARLAKLFRASH